MLAAEKLRQARVVRVKSVNQIELTVDLGFGVSSTRAFTLDDIRVADVPEERRSDAVHCLVVLLGGKRVVVQPENFKPTAKFARIYLAEKIYGSPVGLVQHAPGFDRSILDVSVFFQWLSGCNYSLEAVKEVINGNPVRNGK